MEDQASPVDKGVVKVDKEAFRVAVVGPVKAAPVKADKVPEAGEMADVTAAVVITMAAAEITTAAEVEIMVVEVKTTVAVAGTMADPVAEWDQGGEWSSEPQAEITAGSEWNGRPSISSRSESIRPTHRQDVSVKSWIWSAPNSLPS